MKIFNFKSFKNNGFEIPNLTANYVIEAISPQQRWREPIGRIIYTGPESNNEPSTLFNWTEYGMHRHSFECNAAIGLVTSINSYGFQNESLVDGLYYKMNAPSYYNKNGTLKKGFWGIVKRRIKSKVRDSWVSKEMLSMAHALALATLDDEAKQPHNIQNSLRRAFWEMGQISTDGLRFCTLSQQFKFYHETIFLNIRGIHCYVDRNLNLSNLGYILTDEIYHFEHEFVYDNNIYPRDTPTCRCTTCRRDGIPSALIDDEGECSECNKNKYRIHSYLTRVPDLLGFKSKKTTPETMFLGCELEYETTNKEVARVNTGKLIKGHCIMKGDGSIQNGFEIVSCPATLDIHLEHFAKFFENLPKELKIASNVGMHVHISREPLSQLSQGKISSFMNNKKNAKFIQFIAGRKFNHFCPQDENRSDTYGLSYPMLYSGSSSRYNTLNLNNHKTIEFRIFSTPLNYKDFASKMQFCQAIADFFKPCQSSLAIKEQLLFSNFMSWVFNNNKFYPELSATLKGFK